MPLYHKKSKSKPSFLSPVQNYNGSFLDKRETRQEKPPLRAYSKSLGEVLAKSAKSDEKIANEQDNDINTAETQTWRDTTRDVARDFESVEISRVKTLNGKTVKSFTRVESSRSSIPNTDANMISITPENNPSHSTALSDMLNDCVNTNLRLGQHLVNVDDLVAPKNDHAVGDLHLVSKIEAKAKNINRQNVQGLKKTLSRFISNLNFMKNESKTQTPQYSGFSSQKSIKEAEIAEKQPEATLKEKSKKNANVLKEKSKSNTTDKVKENKKSKSENVDATKKGAMTRSLELQEIAALNNHLSQEYFENIAKKPGKDNISKESGKGKIKKNKSDKKAEKKTVKNKNDSKNDKKKWDKRFDQDASLDENINLSLLETENFKKLPKSKKEKSTKKIETVERPESVVSELEALTEFNNILSQEYFKNLDKQKAQKNKGKTINKDKSKLIEDDVDKKSKKRKSVHQVQNTVNKKSKKLDNGLFKKSNKEVAQKTKGPTMIHTSKKDICRYKSEGFIERMIQLQNERDVGTYVYCDSCDKIRYLPDVKDPLDLPDIWYCYMNPDKDFNNCGAPDYEVPLEEEARFLKNKYNAGSVVWAKLEGYPWWPAMVEDDPDLEDFYWLDDDLDEEPTWYHVTFFDTQKATRAWIKTKNVEPFEANYRNRFFLPKINEFFKHRIESSIVQALEACKMELLPRLRKYSFVTRYIKPKKVKNNSADGQKKARNVQKFKEKIPSLSQNSVKSSEIFSQMTKPKKISKYHKILSDESVDEILKDVDINHFVNQDPPAEINFDTID